MARTISVADDVFNWLKKEKGDRSYSELLRDLKKNKSNFSEVNGLNIASSEEVKETIDEASKDSMKDIEEKFE